MPKTIRAIAQNRKSSHIARNRSLALEVLEQRLVMAAGDKPNIILINTDDQRYDTLQYMPIVQSQLVAASTVFTNSFVPTAVCAPSRASLFTGTSTVLIGGAPWRAKLFPRPPAVWICRRY